jgi:hypothetical protein
MTFVHEPDAEAVRFVCGDCGAERDFARTPLHEGASEFEAARAKEAEYWEAVHELRAEGWGVSERFGVRCPPCKRRANSGLLDRPIGAICR